MVRDLFVVDVSGLFYAFKTFFFQNLLGKRSCHLVSDQSFQIAADFFGYRGGKDTGIRSRIRYQFFFIQFLYHPQRQNGIGGVLRHKQNTIGSDTA